MEIKKQKDENLIIALAGDVMMGRLVEQQLSHSRSSYLWGDVLPVLQSVDLRLINLETVLTTHDKQSLKVFNFKADPARTVALNKAQIDIVNLANNHMRDFGDAGLIETMEALDKASIQHVGAGVTLDEARKPVVIRKRGINIGVLGGSDNEPGWEATPTKPGIRYIDMSDPKLLKQDIKKLKSEADLIILTIHWGPNMRERPPPSFISFAREMIDAGVDVIHGHSAHIFQGVEFYKDKLILYDTGDLIDDYRIDPRLRNDRSFLFFVEVAPKGKIENIKLLPVLISNFQVNIAHGDDWNWSVKRMQHLSEELGTTLGTDCFLSK